VPWAGDWPVTGLPVMPFVGFGGSRPPCVRYFVFLLTFLEGMVALILHTVPLLVSHALAFGAPGSVSASCARSIALASFLRFWAFIWTFSALSGASAVFYDRAPGQHFCPFSCLEAVRVFRGLTGW
jgi:hypothetical protein